MRFPITAAFIMVAGAAAASSRQAGPCPANPAPLAGALAGWSGATPIAAAGEPTGAPMTIGRAANLRLRPTADVRYVVPPGKVGAAGSHGGIVRFTVTRAGPYRVALSGQAWVDIVRDGKALASTAHGHGPACSGIRKLVTFALKPGRYTLQIAGSATPDVRAMVVAGA